MGTATTKPRYLTKSRFKLGMECPAKLFYTAKTAVYANQNLEDTFLASLAEGGFQVGELAKQYFPGGHGIETLDYDDPMWIYTRFRDLRAVSIDFDYLIAHADTGAVLCKGLTRHCATNRKGIPIAVDAITAGIFHSFPT